MTNINQLHTLPKGWLWTQIQDISETTSGGTPSRKNKDFFSGDIPWLKSGELADNLNINSAEEAITPQALENSSAKIIPKGSLLVALYGATVGKLGLLTIDAAINQAICAIQPYQGVYAKYLFYYLSSYRKNFLNARKGGAQPNISQEIVKTALVPIAPTSEQLRIISKVEELFSFLDAGTASLRKVQAQLKRYRQVVLKYAFEGKLTEEWRKTHREQIEPAFELMKRVKEQLKKQRVVKEFTPVENLNLPKLPETWMWTRIETIGKVVTGTTPKKSHSEYYGRDYPFFKPADLNSGYYTRESADGLSKLGSKQARLLAEKSILITCIGATIGKTGFVRIAGACNQQINAVTVNNEIIPEYVYFMCISPAFQKSIKDNASATTLPILNKSRFEQLLLPLAPYQEQKIIVQEIENLFSVIDELDKQIRLSLKKAEHLHQSILRDSFEGRLVRQDPNDESAEKLLIRIKTGRIANMKSKVNNQQELSRFVK